MKNKISYPDRESAVAELERIINTNYNPCPIRNKKPCRVFQDKDGLWYLTSQPLIY